MIQSIHILPILLITVIILIRAEILKIKPQIYIFKPLSTLLIILTVLISFQNPAFGINYSKGLLLGLSFTLLGDVALMFPTNEKAFNIGLRLFLLAHLIYGIVFFIFGKMTLNIILAAAILISLGFAIFYYLKPNLGKMKLPVMIYIIIISVMVFSSFSLLNSFPMNTALKVIIGAILFYISDLMLAINRFGKSWKYNRISLAFYYGGQILIALSA